MTKGIRFGNRTIFFCYRMFLVFHNKTYMVCLLCLLFIHAPLRRGSFNRKRERKDTEDGEENREIEKSGARTGPMHEKGESPSPFPASPEC